MRPPALKEQVAKLGPSRTPKRKQHVGKYIKTNNRFVAACWKPSWVVCLWLLGTIIEPHCDQHYKKIDDDSKYEKCNADVKTIIMNFGTIILRRASDDAWM